MISLTETTQEDDLEGSAIRVFCDDDSRWQLSGIPQQNGGQIWLDDINRMKSLTGPDCGGPTEGISYHYVRPAPTSLMIGLR